MDLALLVLRIVIGLLFIGHGAQKLFGAFGGSGIEGTASNFDRMGLRPGRLHASAAGVAELGGGLLIALGLIMPLGAAALIAVMTAAVATVHFRNGLWATGGGFEYNLVLVAALFAIAAADGGSWSLDAALSLDLGGVAWAIGALVAGLLGGTIAVLGGQAHRHADRRGTHPHPV
jgi:putative oxidoreductase